MTLWCNTNSTIRVAWVCTVAEQKHNWHAQTLQYTDNPRRVELQYPTQVFMVHFAIVQNISSTIGSFVRKCLFNCGMMWYIFSYLCLNHSVISIKSCNIRNKTFDYLLISRRCVYRAGTRFYMRGLDGEGKVANYVETEQICLCDGHKCSFVQVSLNEYMYSHPPV